MWRIHIMYDYGEAIGYVAERKDFIGYLAKHSTRPDSVYGKLPIYPLAVLQMMRVDDAHQGQGFGKLLLQEFEEKAEDKGAGAIFLIADEGEAQRTGFDLKKFYRKNGYRRLAKCASGPVMLKIF